MVGLADWQTGIVSRQPECQSARPDTYFIYFLESLIVVPKGKLVIPPFAS